MDAHARSLAPLGRAILWKPWLVLLAFVITMADRSPAVGVKAYSVSQTKITSDGLSASSAPKLDESSLRNPSEKESSALHNTVYQNQPGTLPHVSMTPPFLEFQKRPICIPVVENIEVINTSEDDELTLFSIITDSPHFHPPIFKQTVAATAVPLNQPLPGQVLAPLGKTTISVIFVPRSKGVLDGTLVIQTSLGGFLYQAHGEGTDNPYKVSPLLGAKVPVGVPYSPPMLLYNPFDSPLHVKEVYTSEGFLHLNLPKAPNKEVSSTSTAGLWELMPHQAKTVINLSFKSQSPGKYQGFVHMKTDRDNLVIPVEILAIKGGVHRTPEELDFETLTSPVERKSLPLSLLNSGSTPLVVTDIKMLSPDSHLSVDYKKHTLLVPGEETVIASVTYRGRTEGQFSGKLLVRLNNTNLANSRMEVPYKARVLHGSLGYSHDNTTFAVGRMPFEPVVKDLVITNKFPLALVIQDATVADTNFTLLGFERGLVIRPGHEKKILSIQFLASSPEMLYLAELSLTTNASVLRIPLHCYHGRLVFSVPMNQRLASSQTADKEGQLAKAKRNNSLNLIDFGVLGVNEVRARSFNLTNLNPMQIVVHYQPGLATDSEIELELDGVWDREGVLTTSHHGSTKWSDADEPVVELAPGNSALFTVKVTSTKEESRQAKIFFSTQHENITVDIAYQSVHGSLQFSPQPIRFEHSFPGAKLTKPLMAKSTCKRPLTITSITSSDPRIIPVLTKQVLTPNKQMQVGHLVFNPSKAPPERNYMALARPDQMSLNGEPLSKKDLQTYSRRNELWNEIRSIGSQAIHASIVVDTDVVMGGTVSVHGGLFKPSVVAAEDARVNFGLAQVGSVVENYVKVHNPSDSSVYMQLIQVPTNASLSSLIRSVTHKVLRSSDFELSPEAIKGTVVPAHSKAKIGPIFFKPSDRHTVNATFLVKNNLTLLDPIVAHGEGGSGYFHFQAGLALRDSLRFDLNKSDFDVHLTQAESGGRREPITFQRVFQATNKGNLPIHIHSIEVNGHGCSAYGFEIHNCSSFMLEPDQTTDILISFHPDFSASVINRELFVTTSLGIQRIPVIATLPHHMLPQLVEVVAPSATFVGMRQLFLVLAAVVLVLIGHVCSVDLAMSIFKTDSQKKVVSAHRKAGTGHLNSKMQDVSGVKGAAVGVKANGKKEEKEVKKGTLVDDLPNTSSNGETAKAPKEKKNEKSNGKDSAHKHVAPDYQNDEPTLHSEDQVKSKSKKEKDKAEKERLDKEKAEKARADKAERDRADREKAEAKKAAKAAAREQERIEREKAQLLKAEQKAKQREDEELRKQEQDARKKNAKNGNDHSLPHPKNSRGSTDGETRSRQNSQDRMNVIGAAAGVPGQPQQGRLQQKQAESAGTASQGAQHTISPRDASNPWGIREKAASTLHDVHTSGVARGPSAGAGFSSAIGGQRGKAPQRAGGHTSQQGQPSSNSPPGFSSAIGGDLIGGDVIWQQRPPAEGMMPSARPNEGFPSAIGNTRAVGKPQQEGFPGSQSRFNFSNVTPDDGLDLDPFEMTMELDDDLDDLNGSFFSGNPFFNAPQAGSNGFSSALGGEAIQEEADALNQDTFGPSSLQPGSDLSPGMFESPQGLMNGTAAGFPSAFSDLHMDSKPFEPPNKRRSSRFGFPGGDEPEQETIPWNGGWN